MNFTIKVQLEEFNLILESLHAYLDDDDEYNQEIHSLINKLQQNL